MASKQFPKTYTPSQKILENYAKVLINFALNGGSGIKKGDVVKINIEEAAKPLYAELRKAIWKAGGHVIGNYIPSDISPYNFSRDIYEHASDAQLKFFPETYWRGLIDQIDHNISIISEVNKHSLEEIDPKKIMSRGIAMRSATKWMMEKEEADKLTWTVALYGVEAMAQEAGLSIKDYWQQIIKACFLDEVDPIVKWKEVYTALSKDLKKLNNLPIESLHVQGSDVDLKITLGESRKWLGGTGRNIPSFEIFTSPDWRGTQGSIKFNQPLYRYGNLITGIELEFKDGKVIKSKATQNEKLLKQMIATEGANKVGEFSLTDHRLSRITKFMGHTLYDENVGGKFGNTHIALGNSYHTCYKGDPSKIQNDEWVRLGYNESSVHTDIISTAPRTVTATLKNGKQKVIYDKGEFTL